MTLLLLSEVKLEQALPILEFGAAPLFPAGLSFASVVFFPHIILLMIYPASANHPEQAHKAVYIGTLIGSIMLVIIVALTILVLGPNITAESMYPSYLLAQKSISAIFCSGSRRSWPLCGLSRCFSEFPSTCI